MVYHGTTKENAESIVKENCIKGSRGDRHWLGDGVYFYRDFWYALRWIRCRDKTEHFLQSHAIISAELNVQEKRIFSFLNPEHKILFDTVLETCEKKKELLNMREEIVDGAVLNMMFKKMKYGNEYDMVEAIFIHEDKDMPVRGFHSRLYYFPEIQICVKNGEIIEQIQNMNINQANILDKLQFIDDYTTKVSGVLDSRKMRYTSKKKKRDYKI